MTEHNESIQGFDGGNRLLRIWSAESFERKAPKGIIFISHGYAEHSGRYRGLAEVLTSSGFKVVAHDHYGHGQSGGKRADIPRFECYLDDLMLVIRSQEKETPGLPVILLGHSMGGAIVTAFACRHPDKIDALILSGAAIRNEAGASLPLRWGATVLAAWAPNMGVRPFDTAGISRDTHVVEAYVADPLVYTGPMKARMGREMLRISKLTSAEKLARVRVPALILHGSADRIVDPGCSRLLLKGLGSTDKRLEIFDGLYHEILNEPEKQKVFATISIWLAEHF
ncbi:alpha/beta hydrolase [Sediminispirochaeta bajacaliforniensis]|uniref:alpha/beta hydrolase n=1 Tax=Sediminispirochaeta bajacaliforniensis TaxID=148 RepID=UPI00036F4BAC|nr:alpha/beta hydrolase [Sediminispirochaeta bajacaliforniensis]